MKRYLCVHGHFYQPPRENPWLEAVELQDGAYPFHDWNEKITEQCYEPNTASRILDNEGRIVDIVSNYARMSFDIGPTLLSWLEKNSPETYAAILEADKLSLKRTNNHGAAIAQAYNHMIMPLCSDRDLNTQVIWGIRDFRHRFGRDPEGMWLPETAADIRTLEALAAQGIRFTVLAQHQGKRTRALKAGKWKEITPETPIDPKRPYLLKLPSGRGIAVFFYDGLVSRAVAFEGLLESGVGFANRLMGGFSNASSAGGGAELMHIATDGESYGHHHRFGDMALAYALHHIEENGLAAITNYGEYLSLHPPKFEVEIHENTSWSCTHGIKRWTEDCGCNSGGEPQWGQAWRGPLRDALDWLRDTVADIYEKTAPMYLKLPWEARDAYIDVILEQSQQSRDAFFALHGTGPLAPADKVRALKLLELQRHSMLMYTSCGWFFDDLAGIETVQVISYAGRVAQLAQELWGDSIEEGFLRRLAKAESNVPEQGNGADIYERHVRPSMVDHYKVCSHYAINSLVEDYPGKFDIYCYGVESRDYRKLQAAGSGLATGKCSVKSRITGETEAMSFAVLQLGSHDFTCGVRRSGDAEECTRISAELSELFEKGAFTDIVRLMDMYFGTHSYSFADLFRDEQRKMLEMLLMETTTGFEEQYREIYDNSRILMGFLKEVRIPVPEAFHTAAKFTLELDLKRQFEGDMDLEQIASIRREIRKWAVKVDAEGLEFSFRHRVEREMREFMEHPDDFSRLEAIYGMLDASRSLPFKLNLWEVQNMYYKMAGPVLAGFVQRAVREPDADKWVELFQALGEKLSFKPGALPRDVDRQ